MKNKNNHIAKIINTDEFKENSFEEKEKQKGVLAVFGNLKNIEANVIQSYRFDKKEFTADEAKKWLSKKNIKYILFDEAKENVMKKLYTNHPEVIDNDSINLLINEIQEIEDNEIEISNWTSFGGSVWAGNNFIDYLKTTDKEISVRVSSIAASMGADLLPFFKKTTGAEESDIMIHSTLASMSKLAKKTNQQLYDALISKIDDEKFKKITGYYLKDVMFLEGEDRKDIWLTGKEAFEIGLFDEIYNLSTEGKTEKTAKEAILKDYKLVAGLDYELPDKFKNKTSINKREEVMKIDELKTSHPQLYVEVLEEGKKQGKDAEKDRVNTWMVFNDIDPEKVKTGIESGELMNEAEKLNLLRKSQSSVLQNDLEDASPEGVTPDKETGKIKTKEQKEAEELDAALENAGIGKETK